MSFRRGGKRQFLRHLNFDVLTFLEPRAPQTPMWAGSSCNWMSLRQKNCN